MELRKRSCYYAPRFQGICAVARVHNDEPEDWALERGLERGGEVLEEGGALFSSTPFPRHNGQELCPVINHCKPRER